MRGHALAAARHGDDGERTIVLPELADDLEPFLVGHQDVGDDERGPQLTGATGAVVTVRGFRHVVTRPFQRFPDERPCLLVVVNDQNRCHRPRAVT